MIQKHQWLLFTLGLLALFAVFMFPFMSGENVLLTTDAAIKGSNQLPSELLPNLAYHWGQSPLLGNSGAMFCKLPAVLMLFLHGVFWNNWVYPIACFGASLALWFFLRGRAIKTAAVSIAAVAAFWLGSNFSLIYPGHMLKPYVICFFILSFLPVRRAGSGFVPAGLIWGSCVGMMFICQPDIALFCALFSGGFLLFSLWTHQGFKPLRWLKVLLPAAGIAFLFAAGPLLSGYESQVKGSAQMQTENEQQRQAKWDYVTQWSFPPEEMIAFVAPGYTGWRSGEPEGPYWGRMGRSVGWEKTKQGFQNFKLENTYLGMIPVAFALFALFSCWRSKHRAEILFWGGATLVALLLSFGKFFPLYSLFYKLPVVNNIRNPNKFLQVFQVCLAILTAYGFDALWRSKEHGAESMAKNGKQKREKLSSDLRPLTSEIRQFFWFMSGILGLFVLWGLSLMINRADGIAEFIAQGWPQDAAKVIVQNKIAALWHASFMAAVVATVFAIFSFPVFACPERSRWGKLLHFKNWLAVVLVLIVAVDAVKLSKHYLKEMPRSYIEANALTDFLQKDLGTQRVALLSQQGICGIWTTYLLPYNRIPTFNFSDMPRMATDYKAFLEAGHRNPLNMWRFSAVKYLLGPVAAEKQLAGQARKVFSYDLASGTKPGEFRVVPSIKGQHAVFELLNTSPRYSVIAPVEPASDEQALVTVGRLPRPQTGTAEVISYRPGKVTIQVTADAPATLRIAEKWDADWKATVDGESADVQRLDYICQGVALPPGEHEVTLHYAPSKHFFYMQCVGYLVLFVSLCVLVMRRKGEGNVAD